MSGKNIKVAVSIIGGLALAYIIRPLLTNFIQPLFPWLTHDKIVYINKEPAPEASVLYYLAFVLVVLIVAISVSHRKAAQAWLPVVVSLVIFIAAIVGFSFIDSNKMIVECTACNDGVRETSPDRIGYDQIIIASLLCAAIPAVIAVIKTFSRLRKNLSVREY